jgi:peptidoglycan/LPS O-acetylase OafA/YrhL
MKNSTMKRVLELDALRGIAVILVVFFHLTIGREESKYGFKLGVTGVDLFFIISGFVILLTLEKTNNWKDFIVSRFSRLYPTYWFCVTFTTFLVIFAPKSNISILQYLANMTMFQRYLGQPDIDGPYWTMIVEMLFYLFMIGVYLNKKLCKIEIIGCISLVFVVAHHLLLYTEYKFIHVTINHLLPLINHFPLFFAGILFYKIKFEKPTILRYLIIFVCFFIQYNLFFDGGASANYISQTEYGIMLFLYAVLFLLYVNSKLNFIVNPISLFLGNISYSLYLVHQFSSLSIIAVCENYLHINLILSILIFVLPTILTLSTLINRFIERTTMKYIRVKYEFTKT